MSQGFFLIVLWISGRRYPLTLTSAFSTGQHSWSPVQNGDIDAGTNQPEGLFYKDMHHLSKWKLAVDGITPDVLSTDASEGNDPEGAGSLNLPTVENRR